MEKRFEFLAFSPCTPNPVVVNISRRTDGWIDGRMHGCMDAWMDARMDARIGARMEVIHIGISNDIPIRHAMHVCEQIQQNKNVQGMISV